MSVKTLENKMDIKKAVEQIKIVCELGIACGEKIEPKDLLLNVNYILDNIDSQTQVKKKNVDIDEIVRQAKLKAAHKYLGDYQQSFIWAGDIEKFTKELEENIARELKSIFTLWHLAG